MRKLKFIDLFAGLGGFHKTLHELGHECVFASELDPKAQALRLCYHNPDKKYTNNGNPAL